MKTILKEHSHTSILLYFIKIPINYVLKIEEIFRENGSEKNMKAGILPVRTLNANHVKKASTEVNSAAAGREDKKVEKYSNLTEK